MIRHREIATAGLLALTLSATNATAQALLVDAEELSATGPGWAVVLQLSAAGFATTGVELDDSRYYVDISPARWPGASVRRSGTGGVTAYRWAQFTSDPPTVRFVVEHRPGWRCSHETDGTSVELRCRPASRGDARQAGSGHCETVARVRGLGLCTPLRGFSNASILARSLEYLPGDVIRDGLPHFGAMRDDWKGSPRRHEGIDIYVDECDVLAMTDGEVVGIGRGETAGGWIKLAHGAGVETVYVHVRRIDVDHGDPVRPGQRIGRIDGPDGNGIEAQLHLAIKVDGVAVDPAPLFEAAATGDLRTAWRHAVSEIPQRVARRQELLAR